MFLFFVLAQKRSNNWLPFMQLHWFHFSLWSTCKSAEQENGEFVISSTVKVLWFLIWSFATSSREFDLLYTELVMHLSYSSAPVFAHTLSVALLTTVSLSTEPYPCSSLLSCGQARTSYKLFWNVIRQKWSTPDEMTIQKWFVFSWELKL